MSRWTPVRGASICAYCRWKGLGDISLDGPRRDARLPDRDVDGAVLAVGLLGVGAEREDVLRAQLFLDPLRDLTDLLGAGDVKYGAAGLARDFVELLLDAEVRNREVHGDEIDRGAGRARVAKQSRIVHVRVVVRAVGDDHERLAALQRAELVETEHDRVVERGRSAR